MTETDLRHLTIFASAGTGKTFQLTNRYLRLVARGAHPSSILASTFTRLAAGEIRDRILHVLADGARDRKSLDELREHVAPDLNFPRVQTLLEWLVDALDRLQIRTLDSFFAGIVQCFALDLGLSPDLRMADEHEEQALRREAIARMLDEAEGDGLADLLRALIEGRARRRVMDTIETEVMGLYELFRDAPESAWQRIEETVPMPMDVLEELFEAIGRLDPPNGHHRKAIHSDIQRMRAAGHSDFDGWLNAAAKGILQCVVNGQETYYSAAIPEDVAAAYEPLAEHTRRVLQMHVARRTRATWELLRRFHAQFARLKNQRRLLTFADLTVYVADAMQRADMAELCFRLDSRLHHMLLDEMQDTSILQWRALEPLIREIISYGNPGSEDAPLKPHLETNGKEMRIEYAATDHAPERTFFAVGDVKQSIYGWRGASPEVFEHLPEMLRMESGETVVDRATLDRSWRSAQPIIDAVNRAFTNVADNNALETQPPLMKAAQEWDASFVRHETAKEKLPGYVVLQTAPAGDEEDDRSRNDLRIDRAVDLIAELHLRGPALTIGVLTRKNDIANQLLSRLGPGGRRLPVSGPGGGTATDAPAVGAILDLLTLADHPDHTTAAFNVLNSPLSNVVHGEPRGAVAEEREPRRAVAEIAEHRPLIHRISADVRRRIQRDGYRPTIQKWIEKIAPDADDRQQQRLFDLIDLAGLYDESAGGYAAGSPGGLRTSDFVRYVESRTIVGGESAPIQVMTIHKSKGLQFNAVVLPDLDCDLVRSGTISAIYERDGVTGPITRICARARKEVWGILDSDLHSMYEQEKTRMMRESLCLLYVAMTRAESGLYMLINPKGDREQKIPKTYAGLLRVAMAGAEVGPRCPPDTQLYEVGDPQWIERLGTRATHGPGPGREPKTAIPTANDRIKLRPASAATIDAKTHRVILRDDIDAEAAGQSLNDRKEEYETASDALDLRLSDRDARDRGTAIHLLLEQIEWLEDFDGDDTHLTLLLRRNWPRRNEAWAQQQVEWFRKVIAAPAIRSLLQRESVQTFTADRAAATRGGCYVARERPFVDLAPSTAGVTVGRRIIDRLVLELDDASRPQSAIIIDWKTDAIDAGRVQDRAERYREQLEAYRRGVHRMYALDLAAIRCILVFLQPQVTVEMPESPRTPVHGFPPGDPE